VSEVWARRARLFGNFARVWIGGESYSIAPIRVTRYRPGGVGTSVANLARAISELNKGRELTERFLDVLHAEGARTGKPT
jgi:hypothetical protein